MLSADARGTVMTTMSAERRFRDGSVRRPFVHHAAVWASTLAILVTSAGAASAEPSPSPSPSVSPSPEAPALAPSPPDAGPVVSVPDLNATETEPVVMEPVPVAPVVLEPIGDSRVVEPLAATEPILPESIIVTVGGSAADDSQWRTSASAPSLGDVVSALASEGSGRKSVGLGRAGRLDLLDAEFPRIGDGDQVQVTTLAVGPDALNGASFALAFDRSTESPGGAGWMNVSLDTSGMVTQGSAGLGDRLTLMAFPACALTSPWKASCVQGVALPTQNVGGVLSGIVPVDGDGFLASGSGRGYARTGLLSADSAPLLTDLAAAQGVHMAITGGTIVAAVSKANGPAGTFAATDLGMTGSWSVGEQSGSMSYSIPISVPSVAQGTAPSLALTYNSATVDGHNIASNGQGSAIGDGWDLNIPYIERQYLACKFDRVDDKTGDLCWQSPYADKPEEASYVINLNGQTANLIWDGADHGANVVGYFVDGVPNWRVARYFGSLGVAANGDNDGEYFKVETPDGSVFYFGRGIGPGPSAPVMNSVATVPVFGDDVGEPCYGSNGCTQAYRWMLDLSVDSTSNATRYDYTKVTNRYAVGGNTADSRDYTSEIYPKLITYGRTFTDFATDLSPLGGSIQFVTRLRCTEDASLNDYLGQPSSGCPTMDLAHAVSYPDVPVDLICAGTCTSAQSSPAFFRRSRIVGIETISGHPYNAPVSLTSQTVLVANFPPVSDGGTRSLWLDSVYTKYTGIDASTATTYRTEFIGAEMRNRVDPGEQDSILNRRRIVRVLTDSGAAIDVDYSSERATTCPNDTEVYSSTATVPAPAKDCYQVMLTEIDGTPKYGTFHKYLVGELTVHDLVGGQPDMVTSYEYVGEPAWGYGNDLLREDGHNDQTWSGWRGYGQVKVSTVAPDATPEVVSTTTNTYFRGLDGDFLSEGGPRRSESLTFTDPDDVEHEVADSPELQGMLFRSESRDASDVLTSLSLNEYSTQDWMPEGLAIGTSPATLPDQSNVVADLDGNGIDDVVRYSGIGSGTWTVEEDGQGTAASLGTLTSAGIDPEDVLWGQFDDAPGADALVQFVRFGPRSGDPSGVYLLSGGDGTWMWFSAPLGVALSEVSVAEVTGDGVDDLVRHQTGTSEGWWVWSIEPGSVNYSLNDVAGRMVYGDVDGDGLDDVVSLRDDGDASGIDVWLAVDGAGTIFDDPAEWWGDASDAFGDVGDRAVSGDFDGDGLADVAVLHDTGEGATLDVWLSTGSGFTYQGTSGWWSTGAYTVENVAGRLVAGDFDGDETDDIAALYDNGAGATVNVWISTGSGFTYQGSSGWWTVSSGYSPESVGDRVVAGDFDGDHKDDVATFYDYGGTASRIHVWLSTGTSLSYKGSTGWWATTSGYGLGAIDSRMVAGDLNHDGKDDIATLYDYDTGTVRIHTWISTGAALSYQSGTGWWTSTAYSLDGVADRMAIGDFNDDGYADIEVLEADGLSARLHAWSSSGSQLTDTGAGGEARYPATWEQLNAVAEGASVVTFGDFVGDERADLMKLRLTGGIPDATQVIDGATGSWTDYSSQSETAVGDLFVADFTGVGKDDLARFTFDTTPALQIARSEVSEETGSAGTLTTADAEPWVEVIGSVLWAERGVTTAVDTSRVRIGNFDDDALGRADVLYEDNDGTWMVSGDQIAALLDPATSGSTTIAWEPFGEPTPVPSAMDGVVVLPTGSQSWSYAPGNTGAGNFYASSESSTTYNDDALPVEETSITTDGTDTFTTRTTTKYAWGWGTEYEDANPGHLNGFGTAPHIVLPWESVTYSDSSDDSLGEALTGHVKVLYDNATTETANVPSQGLPTIEMSLGADGVWKTAKATYDGLGRILTAQQPGDVAAANGRQTSWVYTVNSDQKGMDVTVTSPDGIVNRTWYDFRTGGLTKAVTTQPTEAESAGQWTHYRYNAAGMLVAGWGPLQWNSSTAPGASVVPTVSYDYNVFTDVPALRTTPTVVTTMSLAGPDGSGGWVMANEAGTVRRSYQYLDGLLRPIETHSVAQDLYSGDHVVTATSYDALGQVAWATGPFVVAGAAQASNPLANPVPGALEQVTYNLHDSSWRPTGTEVRSLGTTISASSSSTIGLTTTAVDPTGLTTIAVSDVAGRLVSQKQVPAGADPATIPATTYDYARIVEEVESVPVQTGAETAVTDTEDNETVLVTDFEGRKVSLTDPNSGYTEYAYDDWSRVATISAGADASTLTDVTTMAYDAAGRLTSKTSTVGSVDSSEASWTYGTGTAFGHLLSDSATTVVDGVDYELTHAYAYDTMHRPTTVTTTLPTAASLGDLSATTYATTAHYDPVTGVQTATDFPAIGGLPSETVTTGFDRLGRGVSLTVGANDFELVKDVTWDATGLLTSRTYGDDAVRELQYDRGTRSVSRMTASGGGLTFQDDLYVRDGDTGDGVDPATIGDGTIDELSDGTLTAITDGLSSTAPVSQCYAYNGLNRLQSAWTIADSGSQCASDFAGNSASLDISDTKYATEWAYSTAGSIVSVEDLLADTTRTYAPDTTHPAAVASITNPEIPAIPAQGEDPEVPAVPVADDTFTYDALGRMIGRVTQEVDPDERTVDTHTLELTWDASSNLVKTVMDDVEVVYLYDGSGQRVAQIGVTGATATAYLGATEVTDPDTDAAASGDLTGTRFYTLGGATVATRTGNSLSFLLGDVQGSAQVMVTHTIDPSTGALNAIGDAFVSRNVYTPYGTTRGEAPQSAGNDALAISRGWLNQVSDEASTGLVYLNARYYDPAVARFVSPDPLMNPSDPRTLDPYMYGADNPVTNTDATGLCFNASLNRTRGYNGSFIDVPCGDPSDEQIDNECAKNGFNCPETTEKQKRCRDYGDCGKKSGQPVQCAWAECGVKANFSLGEFFGNIYDVLLGDDIRKCFKGEGWWDHASGCGMLVLDAILVVTGAAAVKGALTGVKTTATTAKVVDGTVTTVKAIDKGADAAKAADAAAECVGTACRVPGGMCFVAGTLVLLADGTSKPIEEIQIGDRVVTTDPETGEESTHAVTRLFQHDNAALFDVVIDGATITATPTHPFWVVGRGWVTVDDLRPGDALLQPDDTTVTVESVNPTGRTATVYNFEVEDAHDYYVQAGDHWVLVHNVCGPSPAANRIAEHANANGHAIPGVNPKALDGWVDRVMSTPGSPKVGGGTIWWDAETGAVVIQDVKGYGTTFVPDRGLDYFLDWSL